ncbi:MAG: hypothetical protein E7649_04160 [Ruminococcaceae bacterium]|nr:hypothetical protein [Oscillospiraceae bacterium]
MANNQKSGALGLILGIGAGIAAATAGFFAATKVAKEINEDSQSTTIVSPNEKNYVTITCGSSPFAKGLTLIKIKAENEADECNLNFLVGKNCNISFDWNNDDELEVRVESGRTAKICAISFTDEEITMTLYAKKLDEE